MISSNLLCLTHLLAEHGEIHKHRHNFEKGHSIAGRIKPIVQIEPFSMKSRHDVLAAELIRRGHNHNSPYTEPILLGYLDYKEVKVDRNNSIQTLCLRCEECRQRILKPKNSERKMSWVN